MLAGEQCFAYAMFRDEPHAADAVKRLIAAEFATERVGALMLDESGVQALPVRHKTAMAKGLTIGTLLGATVGALVLPGFGLLAVGGAFAVLEGATIGGATGTLAGAMGGLGFWKDEIDFPLASFERGGVLVGVLTSDERSPSAKAALIEAGAPQVWISTRLKAEAQLHAMSEHAVTP